MWKRIIGAIWFIGLSVCGPADLEDEAENINGYEFIGGYIMVPTPAQLAAAKGNRLHINANIDPSDAHRWAGGVIPYEIDPNPALPVAWRTAIAWAMSQWSALTNVRFVPRWPGAANYAYFTSRAGGGCSSYVGMIGTGK